MNHVDGEISEPVCNSTGEAPFHLTSSISTTQANIFALFFTTEPDSDLSGGVNRFCKKFTHSTSASQTEMQS